MGGADLVLCREGALWWPDQHILVVSDLHLEKGSAYASGGQMLPPYDTAATLGVLESLCLRLSPRMIVSLGDSFHDRNAHGRLSPNCARRLSDLTRSCDWVWIAGNHDPDPPAALGGRPARSIRVGGLVFRHEPEGEAGEISGHLHPVARVAGRGRSVRRRCFVTDRVRLSMPAMGAYAGGLNVLDRAFHPVFPNGSDVFVIGLDQIYHVSPGRLIPDLPSGRARRLGSRGTPRIHE